jgi:hypothetical protein
VLSASTTPLDRTLRFDAAGQATKVVAVTGFAAACAAATCAWGLDLSRTYGLAEGDGGSLRPLWQRAAVGGGVAALGLVFLAGMIAYLAFYVARLEEEDGGARLRIVRLFPYPPIVVPVRDARLGKEVHRGDPGALGLVFPRLNLVDAPWLTLTIRGRRWPLIVDCKGRFHERSG